ncbi:hypothetical protein [Niveibacterium sp. SC-1]|uniref:hypothetical protein n=1 Tax=Niveibacterium sp. SC-1 TaxID=3135646 RepID=UPI00311E692C
MKARTTVLTLLLAAHAQISAGEARATNPQPTFSAFPAEVAQHPGRVAEPRFATPAARRYRTVITHESRQGPNFAGHYRIAVWGCGTDCRGFAIVDLHSGRVYVDRKIETVAGIMGNDDPRLDFRLDSALLVISGQINEVEGSEARYFYAWDGKRLRLVEKRSLPLIPFD